MADLPPYPGVPRWVKVFGIVVVILVAVFVILHATGRGFGGHMHGSDVTEQNPKSK
jgi:hypothetical protein